MMKRFADEKIAKGIWAASLTPIDAQFDIDSELLAAHAFDLLQRGCQGIVLFGTTGEGTSFSLNEKRETLSKCIANGFPPDKLILANGNSGLTDTIELTRAALKEGCAGVLVSPPCFFKNIQEEGVASYYREILKRTSSSDLKLLLYHIPQNTGIPITPSLIRTLTREFPETVIGMKESEGNLALVKTVLEAFPDFQVFVGKELHIPEAVRLGAAGSICGLANLFPEKILNLYERKKESADLETLFQSLKAFPFVPAAKAIMESRQGSNWHLMRPPLISLSDTQKADLISAIKKFN